MKRGAALAGGLLLLVLLRVPGLIGAAWGNAGMLTLRDELIARADLAPGIYPVYGALDETPATARMMQTLRSVAALDRSSPSARWALGRAALAVGDVETAADVLQHD